ncbi:alkaline shock response membrane anchor protein AmaP [Furfurilactobacillus sp. WILCCON 0119]|uniref:alkaline shock response membrane anchor protein AmaP n=1 Tax=Furfurilactobacillus entadae TaxID=2922307 RepID=UPI0035F084F9
MRLLTKWVVSTAGIIVILTGLFLVTTNQSIPPVSTWLHDGLTLNAQVTATTLIVIGVIVTLIGLIILLIGLLKPRTVTTVQFHEQHGTIFLPVAAIERDLKYRIETTADISHVVITLRIHHNKRADVTVHGVATALEAQNFEALGTDILGIIEQYLHAHLGFTLRHRNVNIEPVVKSREHGVRVI